MNGIRLEWTDLEARNAQASRNQARREANSRQAHAIFDRAKRSIGQEVLIPAVIREVTEDGSLVILGIVEHWGTSESVLLSSTNVVWEDAQPPDES